MKYLAIVLCAAAAGAFSLRGEVSYVQASADVKSVKGTSTERDEHGHDDAHGDKDHEHEHAEEVKAGENGDSHAHDEGAEHGHAEHDEHGHEEGEEGGSGVGPDKGVLEASEEQGIRLAPEAIKTFELETVKINGSQEWIIPASAQVKTLEELNIYRLRAGFFKRIDFAIVRAFQNQLHISSKELASGDEVVTAGVGFLRIAELVAFGGAAEGHSH